MPAVCVQDVKIQVSVHLFIPTSSWKVFGSVKEENGAHPSLLPNSQNDSHPPPLPFLPPQGLPPPLGDSGASRLQHPPCSCHSEKICFPCTGLEPRTVPDGPTLPHPYYCKNSPAGPGNAQTACTRPPPPLCKQGGLFTPSRVSGGACHLCTMPLCCHTGARKALLGWPCRPTQDSYLRQHVQHRMH